MKKAEAIIIFILLNILCFLIPQVAHTKVDTILRDNAMEETMYVLEKEISSPVSLSAQETTENIAWFQSGDIYAMIGLQMGYLKGNAAYDFNHHTSELEFPMDNFIAGGDFSFGYKDLSLNAQIWLPVDDYAGFEMKDKDWNSQGVLTSYTKSKAYIEAIIWDANFRYNFYKKASSGEENTSFFGDGNKSLLDIFHCDAVKIGALLGYRYERFNYDMYDIWDQLLNTTTHQRTKVLGYKLKYWLPYLGLATDIFRQDWGVGFNLKYSFYPIARDIDYHFLRDLTFYGDYEKNGQVWMGGINWFWEFVKNWKVKLGVDGTLIRIDGITWDETHSPAWDADQSTDTKHWIYWGGVEYKF